MTGRMVWTAISALSLASACGSLDITNPNEPDYRRAIADPRAIDAVAGGALRTWMMAYTSLDAAGAMSTQARAYSASWNNGNMDTYSSLDTPPSDTTIAPASWTRNSRGWRNDPIQPTSSSVAVMWSGARSSLNVEIAGVYSALSSANDALLAIKNGIVKDSARSKRIETVARLIQGASLMVIALNYDRGFIVDENTDVTPTGIAGLSYATRKQVRDAALTKLDLAIALADKAKFTTEATWTNGVEYTSAQVAQLAHTLAAMTLAWYPRDATETVAQVDWAGVVAHATKGMSTTAAFDFGMMGDGLNAFGSDLLYWCNSIDACRVTTRVAHFLDPQTQLDPFPLGRGNPPPRSLDRRLGDGSFAGPGEVNVFGTIPKTAAGGSDFAWSSTDAFRPDRGFYHQSNIGHTRYDESGVMALDAQYGGYGWFPVISATTNDLLWAEALLRLGGASNTAEAAALINKTRVGRGGLPPSSGADPIGAPTDGPCMSTGLLAKDGTTCTLFSKLLYENEVELLGLGAAPYYNQRHLPVVLATNWERVGGPSSASIFNGPRYIQGLIPGTPREMPVPYTELIMRKEPLYTWGGTRPPNSPTP